MKDGPVYITALNISGEYQPVMMGVIADRSGYKIGFKKVNGSVYEVLTYHYKDEKTFDSEEDAQSALNEMATMHRWKPYQKLRRW